MNFGHAFQQQFSEQCIPSRLIKSKPSLPLITQQIKRLIRKRDHLYHKFKNSGDQQIRSKFVVLRIKIKAKIKASHMTYLEGLLGLEEGSTCVSKKTFCFSEELEAGPGWQPPPPPPPPPLKHSDKLITDTQQKANLLNSNLQSVFTTKGPMLPSRMCTMKLQSMTDEGLQDTVPAGTHNPNPVMEEFGISTAGILKLLKTSNQAKQLVLTDSSHSSSGNLERKLPQYFRSF